MKTGHLARIMLLVGGLGWTLLLIAASLWWLGRVDLTQPGPQVPLFIACVLGGSLLAGLCQAWLGVFAWLTGRALGTPHGRPTGVGVLLGGVGCVAVILLVVSVLRSASSPHLQALVSTVLGGVPVLVAVLLAFELAWIRDFDRRSASAEGARL